LVFHLQIYCTLISITPLLFSLAFPLIQCWSSAFRVFCCVLFLHRCNLFQHYSLHHSLFLSILHVLSSNSPTIGKMSLHVCSMIMIVFVYTFIIGIYLPYMRENMWSLSFWTWLISLNMTTFSFIHLPINITISFFLWLKNMILHLYTYVYIMKIIYTYICNFHNLLISWKTPGLFMYVEYCQ
jgi:hypothetical protein